MAGRKVFLVEFAFVVDDRCALPGEADQSSPPAGPVRRQHRAGQPQRASGPPVHQLDLRVHRRGIDEVGLRKGRRRQGGILASAIIDGSGL